jgi:hypothetical protein
LELPTAEDWLDGPDSHPAGVIAHHSIGWSCAMSAELRISPVPEPEEEQAIAEAVRRALAPERLSLWREAALREGVEDQLEPDVTAGTGSSY